MKLSYNWLKDLWKGDFSPEEIGALLTSCGLETEGIEAYSSVIGNLEGLIIGEVVEKWQHPDADRLSLTKVNIGQPDLLQIVCGAPNVEKGQKVIVAPVGCTIHPLNAEPWEIKKGKIRGQSSEGMLCAADEIGLGNDHSGIMVLPENAPVGAHVNSFLEIYRDHVLEIGLTPNRGDAASVLGVAGDLQALTKISPNWPEIQDISLGKGHISIEIQNADACPRYSGLYIKNIHISPSPEWMQNRLKAIGIRPKNIVVDSTNFVLHEFGQPIHAFDASKIRGGIIVRNAQKGEKLSTLDEVERTMQGHELLICDHEKPLALAGVFGGLNSGVTDTTTDVFIESAYFNPAVIRRSAKSHGLHTDASFRYERGTDPEITVVAARRVAYLIMKYAGGQVLGNLQDEYPNPIPPHKFIIRPSRINALCGAGIAEEQMKDILTGLDIQVETTASDEWSVQVPARKHDVTREVDIVEEILRIYGYDNIPFPGQIRYSGNSGLGKNEYRIRQRASSFLVSNGFHEILTNPLSAPDKQSQDNSMVQLRNPLSNELSVLRNRMASTCLEAIAYNIHRKNPNIKFFEFGRVYGENAGAFVEQEQLILMVSGDKYPEAWNQKSEKAGYFYLKAMVEEVLKKSGLTNGDILFMDAVSKEDLKKADIKQEVWMAVINWEPKSQLSFEIEPIRKFPEVRRDLSLVLQSRTDYAQIEAIARKVAGKRLIEINLFDAFEGKPLEPGTKSYAVSLVLYDDSHTLTEKEIDQIMQKLIRSFEQEAGATIRR